MFICICQYGHYYGIMQCPVYLLTYCPNFHGADKIQGEEPFKLDLVLTINADKLQNLHYQCPFRKSSIILEIDILLEDFNRSGKEGKTTKKSTDIAEKQALTNQRSILCNLNYIE